ncbi:MAG TPA: alpha-hydroxy acid oxidase [Devosiaceae bacterium]
MFGGVDKALNVGDLMDMARRRVPKMFFDYADSGSWTEQTYAENASDFAKVRLAQRVAVNLENRSLRSTMIGEPVAMPVALAPTGMTGMQHADGEILAAQAAEQFGIPFTLSTMSICSIEDVAANTRKPFWFQLYVMRDRGFVHDLIDRAKAAKCSALVLTMDLQLLAQRHKDLRNDLSGPPRMTPKHIWQVATRPAWALRMLGTNRHTFGNLVGHAPGVTSIASMFEWTHSQFDPRLSWDDVGWIRERWGGKLIIKGILDARDARHAVDSGADALIVSNHGGRQLDGAFSTIRALPEIVEAVSGHIEIHLDGGIRSGQDVLKARALGARGVYIGRPFLYGLGAGGRKGVRRVLDILAREMDLTMALCGERDIEEVGPQIIKAIDFPVNTAASGSGAQPS